MYIQCHFDCRPAELAYHIGDIFKVCGFGRIHLKNFRMTLARQDFEGDGSAMDSMGYGLKRVT